METIVHSEIKQDNIDRVCEEIKLGIIPNRWSVLGNVERIINRLIENGIYQPHHEDMLWDLADLAKESL